MNCKIASILIVVASALLITQCAPEKYLHASILDTEGNPIPDAVFYAEASTHESGAFDFLFAVPDEDGEVGSKENPATIRWKPNAKLSIAAFAPNKKTIVIFDHDNVIIEHGIVLKMENSKPGDSAWERDLLLLSFPFEKQPELAKRLSGIKPQLLRNSFLQAYNKFLSGKAQPTEKERRKVDKIRQLEKECLKYE